MDWKKAQSQCEGPVQSFPTWEAYTCNMPRRLGQETHKYEVLHMQHAKENLYYTYGPEVIQIATLII